MDEKHDSATLLDTFLEISLQLTGDLDIDAVLTAIVERSMDVTKARYGAALTLSADGGIERFIHRGLSEAQVAMLPHLPEGKGLLGVVLTDKVPTRVEKIGSHPESVGFPDDHVPMDGFLGIPLLHRGNLVGALYLTKPPGEPPFTLDDELLLTAVGAIASVGIINARLYGSEIDRAERGALLRSISSKVRRSLDVSEVLDATVQTLGRASGADRCFIQLVVSPEDPTLQPIEHEWTDHGIVSLQEAPVTSLAISKLAARTRVTQSTSDALIDSDLIDPDDPNALAELARAALSTPLVWGDDLLGVATLHSVEPRDWSSSDIALIEAAAREVSVAIHHARLYEEALETARKLEELDLLRSDFVSMVSHELRSPMTVIQGISEILQRRDKVLAPEQRAELVDTLSRESRRLARLVTEILDLEAMESGEMLLKLADFDLGELAHESAADAGDSHRTEISIKQGDTSVIADRDRIKQVFLNLLSNASKFSETGTPIVVEVEPERDAVMVSVTDRGPGIADSEVPRLFQRFSRLPSTSGTKAGSGLGLYLSRRIVEQHGGTIWAGNHPDAGARFSFRLPRRSD